MLIALLSLLASGGIRGDVVQPALRCTFLQWRRDGCGGTCGERCTQQILVQAYSFTSAPIAKALVDAHHRGVNVLAVLDKSNETEKYSAATFW